MSGPPAQLTIAGMRRPRETGQACGKSESSQPLGKYRKTLSAWPAETPAQLQGRCIAIDNFAA